MYRPKDWKNPHEPDGWEVSSNQMIDAGEIARGAYEAGADAMLEKLRGQGWRIETIRDVEIPIPFPTQTKGWLVLIPDEEKAGA